MTGKAERREQSTPSAGDLQPGEFNLADPTERERDLPHEVLQNPNPRAIPGSLLETTRPTMPIAQERS